jgi:hypothetical protein
MRHSIAAIIVLSLLWQTCVSTGATQPEPPPEPKVIKVYPVEDLFRRYTDQPLPRGHEEPSTRPAQIDHDSLEALASLIQTLVRAEDWVNNGGEIARLEINQETLVVSAPVSMHTEVEALIAQIRSQRSNSALVSVQAHWVVLRPDELEALQSASQHKAMIEVSDEALKSMKIAASGRTTSFAGQLTHVHSQQTRSYIHSVEPVVATSAVGYSVNIREALTSAALEVRVDLSPDQKLATVNLNSRVSESQVMDNKDERAIEPVQVVQPRVSSELSSRTTVRVPVGKRVLLGGMTFPMSTGGTMTCLVIQVNVSE